MTKLKASAAVDEDEDLLDDILDEDTNTDDEDDAPPPPKKKVRVATDDDDDDAPAGPPVVRRAPPVAKAAKPVIVSPPPGDEDVSDADFDREAKKRKAQQKVDDFLERKRSEETVSVDTITEMMMDGDTDKIMHELVQYCADNSGIKKAKQLLREARDRAKARVTRIAGVVSVMLDELKEEDDSKGGGEY